MFMNVNLRILFLQEFSKVWAIGMSGGSFFRE